MHIAAMIDLETLALTVDCVIVSGAVVTCDLDDPIYKILAAVVCYPELDQPGRIIDPDTVKFWITSGNHGEILHARTSNLTGCLLTIAAYANPTVQSIWSKGADFDIAILEHAYRTTPGIHIPWYYRQRMCFRTLVNLFPDITSDPPDRAHTALGDAKAQLEHLHKIWQSKFYTPSTEGNTA